MQSKKKKYFLFPKLHFKHLLFLFFFIIACIKKGIQIFFEQDQRISIEFIKLYIYDFGDFLSIIPLIITQKRTKNNKNVVIDDSQSQAAKSEFDIEYIHNDVVGNKRNCAFVRIIFIFTIVDFVSQISSVVYYVIINEQKLIVRQANLNSALIFNISAIILFSICLLHTKVYTHHLFAILINLICLIILTVIDVIKIYDSEDNETIYIIYLLVRIFSASLYSLENVLGKIIFVKYYFSTYGLLVFKSIIHMFYLTIFSIPFIYTELQDKDDTKKTVFKMITEVFEDKIFIPVFIIYAINSFFYNNLCLIIIDVFSPNHFVISRLFENFGVFIIDLIANGIQEGEYLALRIILFIFMIISAFIYNEFLVINVCDLSKNTKLFLDYEAKNELSLDNDNCEEDCIEIPEIKSNQITTIDE